MNDCIGKLISTVCIAGTLRNYMINLLFVSIVAGLLILSVKVMSPFFKSRYSIGLKQLLWVLLAIRLMIPVSYVDTFFKITEIEYENGAKAYNTARMNQKEDQRGTICVALPENVERQEALKEQDFAKIAEEALQNHADSHFSDQLVSLEVNREDMSARVVEEKTFEEKCNYYLLQAVHFLDLYMVPIGGIYIGGIAVFIAYHLLMMNFYSHRRKKARKKVEDESVIRILNKMAEKTGVRHVPELYEIEGLAGPMAAGFFQFCIYIPKADYKEKELSAVFTHELIHIRHQDLRIKMFYLIANALHWFNPLVYLMLKEAGKDMELYCDKTVVEMYSWQERQEYNEILLHILKNHTQKVKQEYLTTCFKGGVKEMKERFLVNLDMKSKKEGMLPTLLTAVIIALSAGIFSIETRALSDSEMADHLTVRTWARVLDSVENSQESLLEAEAGKQKIPETETGQQTAEDVDMERMGGDSFLSFTAGKPEIQELEIKEAKSGYWRVPIRMNDDRGAVDVDYRSMHSDREPLEVPPTVQIYCGNTEIPDYAVTPGHWEGLQETDEQEFFRMQCTKGEANPLFYVRSWRDFHIDSIRLFFPDGQMPDLIEVEDRVYNEDGSIRFARQPFECIYRSASQDKTLSVVEFSLAEHYSLETYEDYYAEEEDAIHPYYRGYSVNCYWATKNGYQSCTYHLVLRTQTTLVRESSLRIDD